MNTPGVTATEVIAFCSGKGGTGKTSLIAALGYALSYSGHNVLMVDADRATDGLSLFILGPQGMGQLASFRAENTFTGILEGFERTHEINAKPRLVHRAGPSDHDRSYQVIISGRGLYGDQAASATSTDDVPDEPWNRQFSRPQFQAGVQALFGWFRTAAMYDYVLVDSRGGFSFESTDVAAAADSFILVTEAATTNFYQDRNLVDRIDAAAAQMDRRSLLRGIIVNKAIEPPELSFRQALEKEFHVRMEDTFPIALDAEAARVYKTQRVVYRDAPASRFAYDSLQAFQQILRVVTGQWPEDRARKWNELVAGVETAIDKHNAEVEAERKRQEERVLQHQALEAERATLRKEVDDLKTSRSHDLQRHDMLFEEFKTQARQREEAYARERARDEERVREEQTNLRREIERLSYQLRDQDDEQQRMREMQRNAEMISRQEAAEKQSALDRLRESIRGERRLYIVIIGFLVLMLGLAVGYVSYLLKSL